MGGIETDSGRIIRKLKDDGFVLVLVKGSHHKFRKAGKTWIVPHPGRIFRSAPPAALQNRRAGFELCPASQGSLGCASIMYSWNRKATAPSGSRFPIFPPSFPPPMQKRTLSPTQ